MRSLDSRGYVGNIIVFVSARFPSHGFIQVRLNGSNLYLKMINADMAFTGDFNTPVTVHVTVTFYICLTVYADPSTSCALCAGCKRVSIEFITCNATKKTTRPIGGKNSCRLSIFVPIEVQKNSIDISRDQWDLLSRVLWENIVIKSPLSNLQFKTIAGLTVSVLSRMFHHVNFEMHSP